MDESLLKADVFFFVTTIAVIVITAVLVVGLLYILSILKTIKEITKTAKEGTEIVVDSIHEARDTIKREGAVFPLIGKIFKNAYRRRKKQL